MALDRSHHPCFDADARHQYGRIHLPVAPKCNVQCNFCDRRYDCPNESRPGVTSTVLTPPQAAEYLTRVMERVPDLAVVGIAGPGDPFANAEETMKTLRLVREQYPEMLLCVATNGLGVGPYVDELADLNVSHVTITVNAVDPDIGTNIYTWMRDGTRVVRGLEAARLLLGRQLEAIRALKERRVTIKINAIIIPGVNDEHIAEIARVTSGLGADMLNAIPLYPVEGTPFGSLKAPTAAEVARVRAAAGEHLPQMSHCSRCRADAVGKLGEAMTQEILACLHDCASGAGKERPYVAVASEEGLLVNLHLGEADSLMVFGPDGALVASRPAPPTGLGVQRWVDMGRLLDDCRALLVSGAGETPRKVLEAPGCGSTSPRGS